MKKLYETRITNVRNKLEEQNVDAFLITNPTNVYYLTGFSAGSADERALILLITDDDVFALTNKLYEEEISRLPYLSLAVPQLSRGKAGTRGNRMSDILKDVVQKKKIARLGVEADSLFHSEYARLVQSLPSKLEDASGVVEGLRAVKSDDEIRLIKRSCAATTKLFRTIEQEVRRKHIAVSEQNIQQIVRTFLYQNTHAMSAFDPIVAVDAHAAHPHYHETTRGAWKHLALIDLGLYSNRYASDCTRVLLRHPHDTYKTLYNIQLSVIDAITPGMTGAELHNYAVTLLRKKNLADAFTHSLGHGIGLSVHERPHIGPLSTDVLQPNMVFTIEPGVYFPRQLGMRIEDTVVLTSKGATVLTNFPKRPASVTL